MKTWKTSLFLLFLLVGSLSGFAQRQDDALLQLLRQELQYSFDELKKQDLPPYHMSFRMTDSYVVNLSSSFGAVNSGAESRARVLVPQIRLGSEALDNFKYATQGAHMINGRQASQGALLPLTDGFSDALRESIWQETLARYEFARNQYESTKSKATVSVEDEDKAPCFSEAPVSSYYEAPLPDNRRQVDMEAWGNRLDEISAVFKSYPELQQGAASLSFEVVRTYFLNSDGSEVVQNRVAARVMISAGIKAEDGMELPLNKDYFAFDLADLPGNDVMVADARDMVERLKALYAAPVADPYTGPAILSGPASGVFFHEIFGHRLEGHRLKTGGQTFKKMVGEQVLPREFAVYCDPTLSRYAGTDLNGYYLYDDEGVKARRVDNVVDGVLKEFLMSRVPLDGFPASNGHARTSGGSDPVSRQSNLVIETSRPYTEAQLRKMLKEEAKKQGKEYGYYIRTVTSGFTYTGEGGSLNSFNVTPLEVYRVYVDGREDELVRGVDMIGTPLSMFSNIAAAGDQPTVFTGSCGAESGWVPVTASSPMIYVSQIETQRRAQSRDIPSILPAPTEEKSDAGKADDVIFSAMQDEMTRNLHQLALPDEQKPYYISYTLGRFRSFQVSASLGGVAYSFQSPWSMSGGTQVMLGDYQYNSDVQYMGQMAGAELPSETDYYNIRRGLWASSDMMYRYALNSLIQKTNYLKTNPLPEDEASVPDMQELPASTHIGERDKIYAFDMKAMEQLAARLSAVFKDYKDLYGSEVYINGAELDVYRLTTENVKLKSPFGTLTLAASAEVRTDDGAKLRDSYSLTVEVPADLPAVEELEKQLRNFAEGLMRLKKAPMVDEYYTGPILLEGEAVATALERNLLGRGGLVAMRTLAPSQGTLDQMLGRKVIDTRVSIKNYTNRTEYNGTPLYGHYEVDADGVTPAPEMTLVEKGIFKRMLNGRYPTLKAPETTGSSRFSPSSLMPIPTFGTVHISVEKGIQPEKLKKELLKVAKAAGLEYAYIVRRIAGNTSLVYRVNVKDGKETQVRVSQLKVPEWTKLTTLGAISSKENVKNYTPDGIHVSIIYPSGMIVNDLEINRSVPKAEKAPAILPPLQR